MFDCISSHHRTIWERGKEGRSSSLSGVAILSQHSSLSTSYAATAIITLGWQGRGGDALVVEEESSSKIDRVGWIGEELTAISDRTWYFDVCAKL